jgi:crotonobetainyl-CoA:carnitine CoA-transferase CaiB-like acyl-CoA transferase
MRKRCATGFFRHRVHPTEGGDLEAQPPLKLSTAPVRNIHPAPGIGADTVKILAELGISR